MSARIILPANDLFTPACTNETQSFPAPPIEGTCTEITWLGGFVEEEPVFLRQRCRYRTCVSLTFRHYLTRPTMLTMLITWFDSRPIFLHLHPNLPPPPPPPPSSSPRPTVRSFVLLRTRMMVCIMVVSGFTGTVQSILIQQTKLQLIGM